MVGYWGSENNFEFNLFCNSGKVILTDVTIAESFLIIQWEKQNGANIGWLIKRWNEDIWENRWNGFGFNQYFMIGEGKLQALAWVFLEVII
jgi:hypothetical protein